MHVIFRESHGLEETGAPVDIDQSPADLVVLSFSDSDLGAFSAGWHLGKGDLPNLRLANLIALKHPLSIDTYIEKTLVYAKGVLIRLIGGMSYWDYGLHHLRDLALEKGIALAILPADGRVDAQLDEMSTLPVSTLRRLSALCDTGGAEAARAALGQLALAAGLYVKPSFGPKRFPRVGGWQKGIGIVCPALLSFRIKPKPLVIISFYLSYLTAADLDPFNVLSQKLKNQGFDVLGLFAPSLKDPEAAKWMARQIGHHAPVAIINATAFSGIGNDGSSPLDAGNVPVFQMTLATSRREDWQESERGLSPADLAMHVVLPEVDGRLSGGIGSFKQPGKRDPDLEFSRFAHHGDHARVNALVAKVAAHVKLQTKPVEQRSTALILSTYPGKNWNIAHAVGLDAIASGEAILRELASAGHTVTGCTGLHDRLHSETLFWSVSAYKRSLASLPQSLRDSLFKVWGEAEDDPAFDKGRYVFRALRCGSAIVALQPERGHVAMRKADYHDTARTPRHSYVAFYLWLRVKCQIDAMIHIGAHGTLEWLPGKSVALSETCWPEALIGNLPVIYPFIVNDPGEAAQAKRRIGAITLGHIPPALKQSATPDRLAHLENLLDEFSNADGLDPKRRDRLQEDIRSEAQALGVEDDLGLNQATSTAEAITRIDRFVCDVKESQFGDGLHIYGRPPVTKTSFDGAAAAQAERDGLHKALFARRVPAGPSGSPYRGRRDVLPTGRNLFTTDPRVVPTRSAYEQGVKLAKELVRRHLQDNGDYPRHLIVDLWGSSTMRTAGEDFAMALHLLGVKPKWDKRSERVNGIEIIPIAELERPRIDVALRVSGLFRDIFPTLSAIFMQSVKTLSERDEAKDWNPFIDQTPLSRVFGPKPGSHGISMGGLSETFTNAARREAGEAWLAASSFAFDGEHATHEPQSIQDVVRKADSFVHTQDLIESDLLMASDYATHAAGFAAAQLVTGGSAALYHLDNTLPKLPRARKLKEEIARVVQARATNPDWVAGMQRHGFRGAAEIAMTLDHLAAFANLAGVVGPHLFDVYYEATLGNQEITDFIKANNPEAYEVMKTRFDALHAAGLWISQRNSVLAALEGAA